MSFRFFFLFRNKKYFLKCKKIKIKKSKREMILNKHTLLGGCINCCNCCWVCCWLFWFIIIQTICCNAVILLPIIINKRNVFNFCCCCFDTWNFKAFFFLSFPKFSKNKKTQKLTNSFAQLNKNVDSFFFEFWKKQTFVFCSRYFFFNFFFVHISKIITKYCILLN